MALTGANGAGPAASGWGDRRMLAAGLFLLLAAVLRAPLFGHPLIWVDEQFYLLVGQQMHRGLWPFTDIWDRKPVGLFVIYWLASFFGDGVRAYQLIAGACAAATSYVIYLFGRERGWPVAGLVAGCIYQLYLSAFHGFGGQSPVFYNLPMTLAGLLIARLAGRGSDDPLRVGLVAMALVGIAIQIKYTAGFEGIFFGLALMAIARQRGLGWGAVLLRAACWAGIAALPTLVVALVYFRAGGFEEFFYTNFLSYGPRRVFKSWWLHGAKTALGLATLVGGAGLALWSARFRARPACERRFLVGWALVAVAAIYLVGPYSDHYRLTAIAPLLILALPMMADWRWPAVLVPLGMAAPGLLLAGLRTFEPRGSAEELEAARALIAPRLAQGGCLFVYDGDPALYSATQSCLLTRFALPQHISVDEETFAIRTSQIGEVERVMRLRPAVVALYHTPEIPGPDPRREALLRELGAHYRLFAQAPIGAFRYDLYALRREAGKQAN